MLSKLNQYCPDLDFDTSYINDGVVKDLEREPIKINNERSGMARFYFPRSRHVHLGSKHLNQSSHPLTQLLERKEITYKGKRKRYIPAYIFAPGTQLDETQLNDATVVNWKRVFRIASRKETPT